jgi:hypothetical protein
VAVHRFHAFAAALAVTLASPLDPVSAQTVVPLTANQSGAVLRTDQRISGDQLKALVHGKTVHYPDGGRETYAADGSYLYVEPNGTRWPAPKVTYAPDGRRCMTYPERTRCDLFVVNDRRLVVINWRGTRSPVRIADR